MEYRSTSYDIRDAAARSRWTDLRERSAHRSPFNDWELAAGLAYIQRLTSRVLFLSDGSGDVAAMMAHSRRIAGLWTEIVPPRLSPETPILYDGRSIRPQHLGEALDVMSGFASRLAGRTSILLPSSIQDTRSLTWTGWVVSPLYTYILDLAAEGDLLSRWSAATRRTFEKHRGAYSLSEDPSACPAIIALSAAAYRRAQRPFGLDSGTLATFVQSLVERGMARVFVGRSSVSQQIEGGMIVLLEAGTGFYWIVGSIPGAAMTVVVGHALRTLQSEGVRLFDFMGANHRGIAEFKRKFGAELQPYYRATRPGSLLLRALLRVRHASVGT